MIIEPSEQQRNYMPWMGASHITSTAANHRQWQRQDASALRISAERQPNGLGGIREVRISKR